MRKLFVRFYLSVLAVLWLAWLIHGYVWTSRSNSDRDRVIVTAHGGGARLMLAELNTAKLEDRQATLLRIRRDFKYPVDLIPIADLPLSLRARVTRSNERIHSLRLANRGEFVELQGSGEEATFSQEQLAEMLLLGRKSVSELIEAQRAVLAGLADSESKLFADIPPIG